MMLRAVIHVSALAFAGVLSYLAACAVLTGCGGHVDVDVDGDAGEALEHDSGHDAGEPLEHDSGHDAGHDTGEAHDAGHDAGEALEHDAGEALEHDSGHDAGEALDAGAPCFPSDTHLCWNDAGALP